MIFKPYYYLLQSDIPPYEHMGTHTHSHKLMDAHDLKEKEEKKKKKKRRQVEGC